MMHLCKNMIGVATFHMNYQISPCSLFTHIHTGRTSKTLCKLSKGEKLVAVQETNSWRECIDILDIPHLSAKTRHSCLSHELTLQVFAVLLLAGSSPWPDDSYQLGTCLTPDPMGFVHKVFSLPDLPVWPNSAASSEQAWLHRTECPLQSCFTQQLSISSLTSEETFEAW